MKALAKCFYEEFEKARPHTIMDAGLRVIEVKRITGTLDKCGELDAGFRYIKRHDRAERSRWNRLQNAAKNYVFFPPIDVVFYRGEYYVMDGNRRVASAKSMKMEFIDAHVKEYILREDSDSTLGSLSRRRFENETGLKSVSLFNETGYALLNEEIHTAADGSQARAGKSGYSKKEFQAGARRWNSEVFIPACAEIGKSALPHAYPELAPGDIFVLILRFYGEYMGGLPKGVNFGTVISGYMFARRIPHRRAWRFFLFKVLQAALMGKRGKRITHTR